MPYDKMETVEKYGTVLQEDKSVAIREEVAEKLYTMLKNSPYTFGELLEVLGWEKWKLERILAGDEEIGIYDLTHITGALGKDFEVVFMDSKDSIPNIASLWKIGCRNLEVVGINMGADRIIKVSYRYLSEYDLVCEMNIQDFRDTFTKYRD